MSIKLQAIRGMNDMLPNEIEYWHLLEEQLKNIAPRYGYQEIRLPIVEKTELFKRSVGEATDIVEKEMYTFQDRDGESLTLRPEGTAGCVRAGIEHGLFYHQVQRLWYMGPIFRHERPQKCRSRQFYQFGLELFGIEGPLADAEIIFFSARLWKMLDIMPLVELQINTLGSLDSRNIYRQELVSYFTEHFENLDADSQRRLHTNPLRILDSKNPHMQELNHNAPKLKDYLDEKSIEHYENLKQLLTQAEIPFKENPYLVRGLDYYCDTVFEWVTTHLGAQGTIAAGGRYDGLVKLLGGQEGTPAVGFALGCERVIELIKLKKSVEEIKKPLSAYFILVGEKAQQRGLLLAEELRSKYLNLTLWTDLTGGSFKNQIKRADKSGAELAIILGENEVAQNKIAIKFLRKDQDQIEVSFDELVSFLFSDKY